MTQPPGSGRARGAGPASAAGLAQVLAERGMTLGERLGEGPSGVTWRAREGASADGRVPAREVAVKRIAGLGRSAGRMARRLEAACQIREPHLLPLLSAFAAGGSVLVVTPLDDGVPLSRLAAGRRLPRACVLAVGLGVLNGLTSLHQAGLWHGAVHPGNVHVGRDGSVRLGHFALTPTFPEQSPAALRTADVRAVGALLCMLLGIDPRGARRGVKAARAAETPIGAAVLAMAHVKESRSGYEAARGSLMLWEAGGRLAASRRQAQAKEQMAALVAAEVGTLLPLVAPAAGPEPVPWPAPSPEARAVAAEPAGPRSSSGTADPVYRAADRAPRRAGGLWRGVTVGVVSLAACALLTVLSFHFPSSVFGLAAPGRPSPAASSHRVPAPPPALPPTANASPSPSPAQPPAPVAPRSAPPVKEVAASIVSGPCAPGSACSVSVTVTIGRSALARQVTWSIGIIDACTGRFTPLASDTVLARPGWIMVTDTSTVGIPKSARGSLAALTHLPARAASARLPLGPAPAC